MPKHRQGTAVGDSEEPYEESEKQPSVEECSEATSPKLSKRSKTSFSTFNSAGADYGLYLTKVALLEEKWNAKALSLADVLEQNSEELERSVQFNFMIDPEWLISCYPQKCRHLPLLIVTSRNSSSWEELTAVAKNAPNVQLVDAPLPIPYGSHHSKMILLKYSSGVRVVIHTANLIHGDWFQKTQGMYLSPIHPPIVNEAEESDSPTNFKKDLLAYLRAYKHRSILEWCDIISKHDFRQAKVYVVGSVPGRHVGESMTNWGHTKLRHLLNKHLKVKVDASWPLICQFSSIGSLGVTPERWLLGEFANSLKQANDVRRSLEGYEGGGCLPYSFKTAFKQEYLKRFLHRWRSECNGRSLACPHIKSYLRCNATCPKRHGAVSRRIAHKFLFAPSKLEFSSCRNYTIERYSR